MPAAALPRLLAPCCALLCWTALAPAHVHAQSLPPDVVQLRDGRLYRGTLAPPDTPGVVVIVLPDGAHKRFALQQVVLAGPARDTEARGDTPASASRGPADRDSIRFRFVAHEGKPMTLYTRTFTTGALIQPRFQPLCSAPCEASLPKSSTHQLAVSAYGAMAQPIPGGVPLYDGATLKGVHTSNTTTRVVLGLLGVGMGVAGAAWLMSLDDAPVHAQVGGLMGGMALTGGGLGLGLAGLILPDTVTLETE